MKTHQGVHYFESRASAILYAESKGYPTDRIIEYSRGFAIQGGVSGDYAGPHGLTIGDWCNVGDVCTCGAKTHWKINGDIMCPDTLAKFKALHGYDYGTKPKAGA